MSPTDKRFLTQNPVLKGFLIHEGKAFKSVDLPNVSTQRMVIILKFINNKESYIPSKQWKAA